MVVGGYNNWNGHKAPSCCLVTENLLNKIFQLNQNTQMFTGEVSNLVTTITVLLCVVNSLLIDILSSQYSQTLIDCFSGISEFEYQTLEGLKWREVNPEIFEFGIVGTEC
jgi:uncharacterized BrkB/YihY/UPF0761 family membrane protein